MRESIISFLVLASIILILVDVMTVPSETIRAILYVTDFIICLVLVYDYIRDLQFSENKGMLLKKYWYEILAFIPAYFFSLFELQVIGGSLRALRLIRLIRILRITGVFARSLKLVRHTKNMFVRGKIHYLLMISSLVILLSSFTVLSVERAVGGSKISNFFDALWWSITTVTTVGYGDIIPVSIEGKIVALFLMIFGVSIWTAAISLISASLVKEQVEEECIFKDLRTIVAKHSQRLNVMTKTEFEVFHKIIEILNEFQEGFCEE